MTFKPCARPGVLWSICQGFYLCSFYHMIIQYKPLNFFAFELLCSLSFFLFNAFFKIAMCLACTHTHSWRSSSTLGLISNDSTIADYNFECPINQAEDEGEEDSDIPGELAIILLQEEMEFPLLKYAQTFYNHAERKGTFHANLCMFWPSFGRSSLCSC